jgi:hypothetical protein
VTVGCMTALRPSTSLGMSGVGSLHGPNYGVVPSLNPLIPSEVEGRATAVQFT